jgi:hypothetical protein
MPKQTYANHRRQVFLWHYVTLFLIIALLAGSIVNLINSSKENLYSASLIVVVAVILISIFWFSRRFALKAQDRAIRAEENLRHFVLTGKLLNKQLRTSQIIALRFAPDEEFVELARRATEEQMRSKQIKKSIRKWKADNNRV